MKPKLTTTLTGIGFADQVREAAKQFEKDQKMALHAKIFEKMDTFTELPAYWSNQLKMIVGELLGRQFMEAAPILTELEKNKPMEAVYNLKMQLETFKRGKVEQQDDRLSFPPVPAVPSDTGEPVQRGASGLNSRVRTLLGPLLDPNKSKK